MPERCLDCGGPGCRHCRWVVFLDLPHTYGDAWLTATGGTTVVSTEAAVFLSHADGKAAAREAGFPKAHVGRVDDLAPWDAPPPLDVMS